MINPVISDAELASIDKPELLAIVQSLRDELAFKQKVIDKITHEMAVLKRLKFAATSEHFSPEQRSLLEETIDTDLAAAQAELDKARAAAKAAAPADKEAPKRKPLPPELPRTEHRHEPESTTCRCGVSGKPPALYPRRDRFSTISCIDIGAVQVEQIRRKRLGSKAWREIVERFAASNESVRQFCGREGLSTETFRRWRVRLAATSAQTAASLGERRPGAAHFVDLGSLGAEPAPSTVSTGSPRRFELRLDLGDGMTLMLVRG